VRSGPLTVALPVRNEGANLRHWWRAAAPHLPPGARVLVVHDFDEDDTVPVARALAEEGAPVRALRSRGAGFPDALLTGLLAAERGPVLVTMADGSDDLAALPGMLRAWAEGADLVVGSRFAPGGRIEGGSLVKRSLGRWGSLVLHRLAGFPVRDASNAFRVYDAEWVRTVRPDRCEGFEVTVALLLAAWQAGARIVEVPVAWRDRRSGASHFRPRWIPRYGRLWLRALRWGLAARTRRAAGPPRHGPAP
jgi:dolichol-phosphate mannosyltransferase